jgi:hypothetical protein
VAPTFEQWVQKVESLAPLPVLTLLAAASAAVFVLSAVGVPWFIARVPADYFSRRERRLAGLEAAPRPVWRLALRILKNALGALLLVAGAAMLFLPGQGVLTMFVGLLLLEFPGKRKLERRLLSREPVRRAINALRRRAGQPPLELGS